MSNIFRDNLFGMYVEKTSAGRSTSDPLQHYHHFFLGPFVTKSYNNTRLSFFIFVSVRPHAMNPEPINGFLLICYWGILFNSLDVAQFRIILSNIDGYFTCRLDSVLWISGAHPNKNCSHWKMFRRESRMRFYEVFLITLAFFEVTKRKGAKAQEVLSCVYIS